MRTKKEIVKDYRTWLEDQGKNTKLLSDDELFEMLIEQLYDTEIINGNKVSSVHAWFLFVNFIIRYYFGTQQLLWNSFVKKLFTVVEHNKLTCIQAQRGSGKSTVLVILYPLFKTFLYDGTDVLLVSNIPKTAKRNLRKLKRFVNDNEILKSKKFKNPDTGFIKWGENDIEYNSGLIETISVGSTARGAHVPLVILDDVLRDDNRVSKSYVRNFVLAELFPTVSSTGGRLVVSGTPSDFDDILHEISNSKDDLKGKQLKNGEISKKGFASYVFPAITNFAKKKVLVPERFTFETLMQIRRTVGEINFAREYMMNALPDSSRIFSEGILRGCVDGKLQWKVKGEPGKVYVIGIDLASSASRNADFSCFVVLEYDEERNVKIVREVVNERLTAEDQEERVVSLAKKFNNAFVYIEKNNMGEFLRQRLVNRNINVEGFTTSGPSKQNFIRFLRTEIVNKKLLFPPMEGPYEVVKTQLLSFGYKEVRGKKVMEALSGHDDIVDALAAANIATQEFNRDFSTAILLKKKHD